MEQNHPGDLVRLPPGWKHWHGATAMSHVALLGRLNGSPGNQMEQISDEQYRAPSVR